MDMSYIATLRNGYNVRIAKIKVRRMFSFNHYGGKDEALRAALSYRDGLYREYGIKPIVPGVHRPKFNSRIENGALSGVALEVDGNLAYFITKYHENGVHRRERFSIRKLGYVEAFRSACKLRIEKADWAMNANEIEVMRPTLDQYLKVFKMANDVPAPCVQ
jgi:hypothetical protein